MVLANIALFVLSCAVLVLAGSFLVKGVVAIANFLKIKHFVVAAAVMAVSTSLPELFVGISSAAAKNSALSLGNVIGANIADLTLVAGVGLIIARKTKITSKMIKKDAWIMLLAAMLPLVLMFLGNELSKTDGIILLTAFALYVAKLAINYKARDGGLENTPAKSSVILYSVFFIPMILLLFYSAKYVVHYGSALALELLLPPIFIGLFFVSLGTTLPEMVFGSSAMLAKHPELSMGNLIGSVIVNSTLVLGIAAIIFPIKTNFLLFFSSSVFLLIIAFLFATLLTSGKINWIEGIALILFYIFFLIIELSLKGIIPAMNITGLFFA
ncbi:MAG: hypothetical protein QW666_00615 [Candidatus Woesearchaeota archaeon]